MHILHAKESIMNTDLAMSSTFLTRGTLQRVVDGKGTLLQCLGGTLWLTQEDDPRDIVLEAGQEARIERDGVSIVSALRDSSYLLLRSAPATH
jgi:hypothetical protein